MGALARSLGTVSLLAVAGVASAQGFTYLQKCADTFLGLELALDYCTRAIKSGDLADDHAAIAHYNRGAILSRRRAGLDKAIADFDESIRLHARPAAYVARGVLKSSRRNFDAAVADFTEAIRMDGELAEAYLQRGQTWLRKGAAQQALEDADQALRLQPVGPIVHGGNLMMYSSRPRPMDRRIHDATAFKLRGMARFLKAEFVPARSDLAETLRAAPGDSETALWLFMARTRSGEADAARAELEGYAKRMPEGSWARLLSSLMLGQTTPQQVSATVAEKGILRQVQRCQASFYSGHWRLIKGEPVAARVLFERAKARCPAGSNELNSAEAELQRLPPKAAA